MKRTFQEYIYNNIPSFIIDLSNSIINKNKSYYIIIDNDDAENLDAEMISNYLDNILNNHNIYYHSDGNISFVYQYDNIKYHIQLLYHNIKDIYKIKSTIVDDDFIIN